MGLRVQRFEISRLAFLLGGSWLGINGVIGPLTWVLNRLEGHSERVVVLPEFSEGGESRHVYHFCNPVANLAGYCSYYVLNLGVLNNRHVAQSPVSNLRNYFLGQ